MKIAVVGGGLAGLAGLAAAWLLSQRHSVTLLERQAQPGFIASSVALPEGGVRVTTGSFLASRLIDVMAEATAN